MKSSFWKSGHTPTLFAAFLYFDLSFMVWYLLGPLAIQIAADLHLTTQQRGLMVATPILAGAVLRFLMGMLADKLSPKTAGLIGQVIVIAALFGAWKLGIHSYEQALLLGVFLGMAGASFAVALPLASQWYPAEHQGKAMGIAGAGNSGTVFAALLAPVLAAAFGWSNVFGFALIPLILTLIVFAWLARNAPERPKAKAMADYFKALGDRDSWWFMFFYSVTFGGFIGLASAQRHYAELAAHLLPGQHFENEASAAEAVIDKDLASSLLAQQLGSDLLVIATDVNAAFLTGASQPRKALPRPIRTNWKNSVLPRPSKPCAWPIWRRAARCFAP